MATPSGLDFAILGTEKLLDLVEEIEEFLNLELQELAIRFVTIVAIKTPKKTGEATGEWQVTINKKASSQTNRLDLNGSTVATEETTKIRKAAKFKFPTIYVSNLAGHINDLNDGTSDQAPAKFIETALLEATSGG